MKKIAGRLSYANVTATLAVFLALGGGALAAVQLPKNSVGSAQLKAGAVTPAKLAKVTKRELEGRGGSTVPAGPAGPAGAAGPNGETGATGEQGPKGEPGERGERGEEGPRGPSDLYRETSVEGTEFLLFSGAEATIASLTVPAGNYLVTAKETAEAFVSATPATLECRIKTGSETRDVSATTVQAGSNGTLSATIGLTLPVPGSIDVVCREEGGEGIAIPIKSAHLTALQVETIH
jgi:hypothetical protein